MRLIHGTALTLFLTLSAHAAIRVSPEIPLAAPTVAPQEGDQRPKAIATDGNQFLIAWTTDLTATGGYAGLGFTGINLALTGSDGHPLARIKLPATEYAAGVALCWTGSVYLASWIDYRERALYTVAVSIDGKLLRQPSLLKQGVLGEPSLCSNGRQTLLLYNDGALKAALIDAAGTAIKTDQPIAASGLGTPYSDLVPHVASDGQDFVAVWRTADRASVLGYNFHLLRIRSDGEVTDPPIELGRLELNNGFGVSFGGGVVAIAAIELHLIKINDVQPRLVRFLVHPASSSVQRLAPVDLPKDYGAYSSDASLFWNGRRFIAYWMEYTRASFVLRTLAFDNAGNDDRAPVRIASGERLAILPLMAFNGRASLAVWSEVADVYFNRGYEIYGSLFDANATRAASTDPPMLLSAGWSRQMVPSIATSESGSLIVWIEETGGIDKGRLVAQRVAGDGSIIDTTPFELAPSAAINPAPHVVFAGEAFLVVWAEPSDNRATTVKARSVSSDRSLGETVSLGQASFSVAAASNGNMALVVSGPRAYRFDARGRQIDIVPLVLNGIGYSPLAASNGTDFFVAWSQGTDNLQFNSRNLIDVFGLRVSAAGVVDATPLPIATGPADQVLAALVSDGRDYLVAFQIRGYPSTVVATKNVLREGVLEGFTASDTGTIIGNDVVPHGVLFALAGDRTGYWWTSEVLVRTDLRGNRTSDGQPVGTLISAATAQVAGGPLRMVLSRRVAEGPAGETVVRAIMRTAAEVSVARGRATRH